MDSQKPFLFVFWRWMIMKSQNSHHYVIFTANFFMSKSLIRKLLPIIYEYWISGIFKQKTLFYWLCNTVLQKWGHAILHATWVFFARIQFYNGTAPFRSTYYIRFGPRLRIYGILARFFGLIRLGLVLLNTGNRWLWSFKPSGIRWLSFKKHFVPLV